MKRILFILILILTASQAWGATYYARTIDGTLYYKASSWPTNADTSAASLQALVNAVDDGSHTLVMATGTYNGGIDFAGGDITIRSALSTDADFATYGGTVTFGPPASAGYTIKINNRNNITISGAITISGFNGTWGYATMIIQGSSNNIVVQRILDSGTYRTPTITSTANTNNYPLYLSATCTNTIIDGVNIYPTLLTASAAGIVVTGVGTGCIIRNCNIQNYGARTIAPPGASTVTGYGIYISSANAVLVHDNTVGSSEYRWSKGILIGGSSAGNTIRNNTVSYCWDGDDYPNNLGTGIGTQSTSGAGGNIVTKNTISYCKHGIDVGSSVGGDYITYNLIMNSSTNGIDHNGPNSAGNPDYILNNTVIHRPSHTTLTGVADGAVSTNNTTLTDTRLSLVTNAWAGAKITCNGKILTVTSNNATTFTGASWSGGGNPGNGYAWTISSGGAGHGIDIQINAGKAVIKNNLIDAYSNYPVATGNNIQAVTIAPAGTVVDLDYNIYYLSGTGNVAHLGSIDTTSYDTLAAWLTAVNSDDRFTPAKDTHSLAADPLFVDPTNGDYRLRAGSPAINAGVDVGLTTDADGKPIIGLPDIGAYEYQPTAGIPAGLFMGQRHKHMIQ